MIFTVIMAIIKNVENNVANDNIPECLEASHYQKQVNYPPAKSV